MADPIEAEEPTRSRVPRGARWALLVLAVLAIVFLRTPDAFLHPSLDGEDATFVFPYYYANRGATGLLRFQAGYVPFVLNAIAFAAVRLPTRLIPYGFAFLPLLLSLAAYVWLFAAPFRRWLGSDATRALLCVLFVLAPLAQYHLYANTTYSIWNALFLFLLIVVTPLSRDTWKNVAAWAAANVLVWSNPATILVAPLVLVRLVRERRARWVHAVTLANLALYNAFGVEKGGIFAGLSTLEALAKLANAVKWTFILVAATAFRTIFGPALYGRVEASFWPPIAVWGVLVAVGAAYTAWRSERLRPVLLLLGYVAFAFTFLSVLGRGLSTLVPLNGAPRYVYLPTLAFLVLYVLLLEHYVVAGRPRRRAAVAAALVALYVGFNAQMGHYFVFTSGEARALGQRHSPYVQTGEGNGLVVRDFFAELAREEARVGSREGIYLKVDKPADWPIIADTGGARPKP